MSWDAIVAGAGGVGSAALFHLARRGARVLGIDRFPPAHDRGSSHGRTRVIRQAYFEHSDYVPLLRRAYELWAELAAAGEKTLYHETGVMVAGPPDGVVVPGSLEAARLHGLEVQHLDAAAAAERFPGFAFPDGMAAVLEPHAGYLAVEDCVLAHLGEAVRHGASLQYGETVRAWRVRGGEVEVETERERYRTARLVLAPGAWAPELLSDLGVAFEIRRKPVFWYSAPNHYSAEIGCPVYLFETPEGVFYGIPAIDEWGLKVAEHSGGETVADPLEVDRSQRARDRDAVENFLGRHLPKVTREILDYSVCLYTMTPDEHFVVDRHPEHPQVAFAAGLSGHGFKFTGVLGEILAELALDGSSRHPIEFLSVSRPGLRAR